jgi:hypothetical protein
VESPPAEPKPEPEAETAGAAGTARLGSARDEAKEVEPAEREPPAVRAALAPQRAEPQPDPGTAGAIGDKPAGAALEAIIEESLVRLNDGVEGRFAAEIGGYGDLDGDGLEDGVVFFTYESEDLKHARFIAAYLYDGQSYALAANKPVAGSDGQVPSAIIDAIADGVISLRLSVLEPGDGSCCPSSERRQRLVLRAGQLVEVTPSASPTPEQAEQRLATKPSQEALALAVPRADHPAETEVRAKSARDERAAEAGGRKADTDIESPARALQTAPFQPGRSLQAPADQAAPGAARLQAAGEASFLDDRPAIDIRIFIHHVAHRQEDAALARQLADHLQRRGFTVADIRPVDFSIGKPSVRYFFARDRAASRRLVEEVSRFFEETPSQAPDGASDFTHFVPKPRPGNVEVWLPIS